MGKRMYLINNQGNMVPQIMQPCR